MEKAGGALVACFPIPKEELYSRTCLELSRTTWYVSPLPYPSACVYHIVNSLTVRQSESPTENFPATATP